MGMTIDSQPVGTKLSTTVVRMCKTRKAIATIETDRCSSLSSKRPTVVPPTRLETKAPRQTTMVNSTSATSPVARVVYQR